MVSGVRYNTKKNYFFYNHRESKVIDKFYTRVDVLKPNQFTQIYNLYNYFWFNTQCPLIYYLSTKKINVKISLSPHIISSSSPDSLTADRSDKTSAVQASPQNLYKIVVPLLRCLVADVRDAAVNAMGMINHDALKDLMDELVVYMREAVDRKQENRGRRQRRDALRLQLIRVLEKIAEYGTFGFSPCVLERESMSLHPTFVEYMDGARLYLEMETDKDNSSIREVKIHFCHFIKKIIKNFSCKCFLSWMMLILLCVVDGMWNI